MLVGWRENGRESIRPGTGFLLSDGVLALKDRISHRPVAFA